VISDHQKVLFAFNSRSIVLYLLIHHQSRRAPLNYMMCVQLLRWEQRMKNLGFAPLKCLCLSRTPMFLVPPMVSYLYRLLGCIHHRSHKLLLKLHIIVGHKHNCTSSLIFFFFYSIQRVTQRAHTATKTWYRHVYF